jgi:hypothetical protein
LVLVDSRTAEWLFGREFQTKAAGGSWKMLVDEDDTVDYVSVWFFHLQGTVFWSWKGEVNRMNGGFRHASI